jgi:hypothetical protein
MERHKSNISGWQDAAELLVAAWLFISPLILGFFDYNAATLTAMLVGATASFSTQVGLAKQQPWIEWFNIALALFLAFSSLIFGYATMVLATWNAAISGLVLLTFAVLAMVSEYAKLHREKQGPLHGSSH